MKTFINSLAISAECHTKWNELRSNKIKGFILALSDDLGELVVDSVIENDATWKEVTKILPDNDCR